MQGIGAGGITALTSIVIGDLVPLKERGKFVGMIAAFVIFMRHVAWYRTDGFD